VRHALVGVADAVTAPADEPYEPHDRSRDETLAALRGELGDDELEAAVAAGRNRPPDDLVPVQERAPELTYRRRRGVS
jgi:hypothetical protein